MLKRSIRFQTRLAEWGMLNKDELMAVRNEVEERVTEAIEFARTSPYPEPETACDDIFADPGPVTREGGQ